jgi:phage/plasmid-like protein (TIGR03299 family)
MAILPSHVFSKFSTKVLDNNKNPATIHTSQQTLGVKKMAHEITVRSNGMAEMAFVGSRSNIWHGLGQEITADATKEQWLSASGLDWNVLESPVSYNAFNGTTVESKIFPDRKALFRSDTLEALSIVSADYKVVQPEETIDFFSDVALQNKMRLSTAGSLFGGKRFWALAETFREAEIVPGDTIKGYLLLTTSVDGTLATTAKFTSTRVVCNNTLTVAMSEKATNNMFRKTHRTVWDAKEAKLDLGLIDESWDSFITNLKKFSEYEISNDQARQFFKEQVYNPKLQESEQGWGATRKVDNLMKLYIEGTGSQYSHGTLWGVLNAVTEAETHGTGRRSASSQFWESYFGKGETEKNKYLDKLVSMI